MLCVVRDFKPVKVFEKNLLIRFVLKLKMRLTEGATGK